MGGDRPEPEPRALADPAWNWARLEMLTDAVYAGLGIAGVVLVDLVGVVVLALVRPAGWPWYAVVCLLGGVALVLRLRLSFGRCMERVHVLERHQGPAASGGCSGPAARRGRTS